MTSLAARRRMAVPASRNGSSRQDRLAITTTRNRFVNHDDTSDEEEDEETRLEREEEEEQERVLSAAHGEASEASTSLKAKQQTDQEIEAEYATTTKKRKPRLTLQPSHIMGPEGLIKIRSDFVSLKKPKYHIDKNNNKKSFSTKAAASYSRALMKSYKTWAYDLFPSLAMEDLFSRIETFGSKREVKSYLSLMRDEIRNAYLEKVLGKDRAERLLEEFNHGLEQQQFEQQQEHHYDDDDHNNDHVNHDHDMQVDDEDANVQARVTRGTTSSSSFPTTTTSSSSKSRKNIVDDSDSEEELEFEQTVKTSSAIVDTDDEQEEQVKNNPQNSSTVLSNPYNKKSTTSSGFLDSDDDENQLNDNEDSPSTHIDNQLKFVDANKDSKKEESQSSLMGTADEEAKDVETSRDASSDEPKNHARSSHKDITINDNKEDEQKTMTNTTTNEESFTPMTQEKEGSSVETNDLHVPSQTHTTLLHSTMSPTTAKTTTQNQANTTPNVSAAMTSSTPANDNENLTTMNTPTQDTVVLTMSSTQGAFSHQESQNMTETQEKESKEDTMHAVMTTTFTTPTQATVLASPHDGDIDHAMDDSPLVNETMTTPTQATVLLASPDNADTEMTTQLLEHETTKTTTTPIHHPNDTAMQEPSWETESAAYSQVTMLATQTQPGDISHEVVLGTQE